MTGARPTSLRAHQKEAELIARRICKGDAATILGDGNKCITASVVPGGGKSFMASIIARALLANGDIDAVLWITPNTTLCAQVAAAFKDADFMLSSNLHTWLKSIGKTGQSALNLETNKKGKKTARNVGVAMTIDGLRCNLARVLEWMRTRRVFVIVDEAHHFSDLTLEDLAASERPQQARQVKAWSVAWNKIHDKATWTLVMTGTLFRNDGLPLAGVVYDANRRAVVHIRYTRQQALLEHAVTRLEVNTSDGTTEMKFSSHSDVVRAQLTQANPRDAARILGHCIQNRGWCWKTIERACIHYDGQWNNHGVRSQMIVLCNDIAMVEWAARKLEERYAGTGIKVVRAHSKMMPMADVERDLARFRLNQEGNILVTVEMAGEGFDAPWIDHLVLLTTVRSRNKLDQFVNRATRVNYASNRPWEDQWAYIYCPADPKILAFFEEYFSETDESYRTAPPPEEDDDERSDKPPREHRIKGGIHVTNEDGPSILVTPQGVSKVAPELDRQTQAIVDSVQGSNGIPKKVLLDLIIATRDAVNKLPEEWQR